MCVCWTLGLAAVCMDLPKVTWLLSKSVKDKSAKVLSSPQEDRKSLSDVLEKRNRN